VLLHDARGLSGGELDEIGIVLLLLELLLKLLLELLLQLLLEELVLVLR